MISIADFGGFTGLAKIIKTVKDTGAELTELAEKTNIPEILDYKVKYIDTLDRFRPHNTGEVPPIVPDFYQDSANIVYVIKSKITDPTEQQQAEKTFSECNARIEQMLDTVMNALKNEANKKAGGNKDHKAS